MKKLAVTLVSLFVVNIASAQDFSPRQTFQQNAKGKEIIKLNKGEWKIDDHFSETNFHIRTFAYSKGLLSDKISIKVSEHKNYALAEDFVDHVWTSIIDEKTKGYKGRQHLFLYRKESFTNEIYAIILFKPDGTEMYFEVEG